MRLKSDVEVLDESIDIIQGHWNKGAWCQVFRGEVTYCVEGALQEAITGVHSEWAADLDPRSVKSYGYHAENTDQRSYLDSDQREQYNRLLILLGGIYLKMVPAEEELFRKNRYTDVHRFPLTFNDRESTSQEDMLLGLKQARERLS